MEKELCTICYRTISDPMCTDCHLKHVGIWLKSTNLKVPVRNKMMKTFKGKVHFDSLNEGDCVVCYKGEVNICYYCFCKKLSNQLKKSKVGKPYVEEFESIFNYTITSEEEHQPRKAQIIENDIEY